MRVRPSGFYEPFFRVVPCGLRAWQGKATTDFHLKPQNRICGPSRHTSPDAMQPVKVQLLSLVWIRHTELPVPRCRNKISLVPGSVIPPLVFCLAWLLFTYQLVWSVRDELLFTDGTSPHFSHCLLSEPTHPLGTIQTLLCFYAAFRATGLVVPYRDKHRVADNAFPFFMNAICITDMIRLFPFEPPPAELAFLHGYCLA